MIELPCLSESVLLSGLCICRSGLNIVYCSRGLQSADMKVLRVWIGGQSSSQKVQ